MQEFLKPVIPYIPRYMLSDKIGTLVEANAYYLSDGDKLYQQVRERPRLWRKRGKSANARQPGPAVWAWQPNYRFNSDNKKRPC